MLAAEPLALTTVRSRRVPALPIGPAAAFGAVAAVHLIGQAGSFSRVADVTKWLLMPLLAVVVATASGTAGTGEDAVPEAAADAAADATSGRPRLVRWVLVALGFSWAGDSFPFLVKGDSAFLVMVGLFLVAQVSYITAFSPLRGWSLLRTRPIAVVPYVAVFAVLVALCASGAGTLLVPVVVYGLSLTAMAVLSTGVGRIAGLGGAVFMASDALIALGHFVSGFHVPGPLPDGFWIMATYLVGQSLIAYGTLVSASGLAVTAATVAQPTVTPTMRSAG